MTISKITKFSSAITASLALTLIAGCGGSGGSQSKAFPSGVYVGESFNHMVSRFADMTALGETTYTTPSSNQGANAIAFDPQGRMYVAGTQKIYRFDDYTKNEYASFGEEGAGVHQFGSRISGLAIDTDGRIYVSDEANKRIVRMDNFSGLGWTTLDITSHVGSGNLYPLSLALDSQKRIYITVPDLNKVMRFDNMSDSTPESLGSFGSGDLQFKEPTDVSIGTDGKIYIADQKNHRIVRMDDMTGTNWTTFGSVGSGSGQFSYPYGITTDGAGRIYVTDDNNKRVVRIDDMTGAGWITFGSFGTGPGQFNDSIGDVLVR